jgi:hypothetical protein
MPLATLYDDKFNQPIFGANNMTGTSPPLGNALQEDIKWCLSFRNGGVGTFLRLFYQLLTEMRQRMGQPAGQSSTGPLPVPQAVAVQLVNAAFVDPSDPSKLYVSQPAQAGGPTVTGVPVA